MKTMETLLGIIVAVLFYTVLITAYIENKKRKNIMFLISLIAFSVVLTTSIMAIKLKEESINRLNNKPCLYEKQYIINSIGVKVDSIYVKIKP